MASTGVDGRIKDIGEELPIRYVATGVFVHEGGRFIDVSDCVGDSSEVMASRCVISNRLITDLIVVPMASETHETKPPVTQDE